ITFFGTEDHAISGVMAIEVHPWTSPPAVRDGDQLAWRGHGDAPAEFAELAHAYGQLDLKRAMDLSKSITDPLARAAVRAWILGYPGATQRSDLPTAWETVNDLDELLAADPTNDAAR